MITDANTVLSGSWSAGVWTGQAVVASPTISTNVLDIGAVIGAQIGDYGTSEMPQVAISVLVAPTLATSVEFQLVQADDAAITTNLNVLVSSGPTPIASLPLGTKFAMDWGRAAPYPPRRYVAVRYVVVGTATSAGTYLAQLVENIVDAPVTFKTGSVIL